ncbi:hypothetical protein QUF63_15550 [Anaerolineales bacterium HSG25]|nr:hypothetical protein [Anaerolineales bacterium HSG25]
MTHHLTLYHADEHAHINWPHTSDGQYARRYLTPFLQNSPQQYLNNVTTDLMILQVDQTIFPVTRVVPTTNNSYVCSPLNHYLYYGIEETQRHLPLLSHPLQLFVRLFAHYLNTHQFEQAIQVNNWLLSTNLYPDLKSSQLEAMLNYLRNQFPDHAIIFRSVDEHGNPLLYQTLRTLGCAMLFSRQIYYQHPNRLAVQRKKQLKIDLNRFRRMPYQAQQIDSDASPATIKAIQTRYNQLYLDKYSTLNPQFSTDFIRLALQNKLLTITILRMPDSQRVEAVLGYFYRRGLMTCPLFGYDTTRPKQHGLYVLLSTMATLAAQQNGHVLNMSGGVGQFKRLRGGIPIMEYNAVYYQHLSSWRQRPWRQLIWLSDYLVRPLAQRYGW